MQKTKHIIIALTLALILTTSSAHAAAPAGGYAPGTTLNPACNPGDENCFVTFPNVYDSNGTTTADRTINLNNHSFSFLGGVVNFFKGIFQNLTVTGTATSTNLVASSTFTLGSDTISNIAGAGLAIAGNALTIATNGITSAQLNTTGVTAGAYGSSTVAPTITVDEDGRVTIATSTLITPDWANIQNIPAGITDNTNIANTNLTLDASRTLTLGTNSLNISATTGDFSVNTDNLFVDSSTGRVGVGTTSPDEKLHVSAGNIKIDETTNANKNGISTKAPLHSFMTLIMEIMVR